MGLLWKKISVRPNQIGYLYYQNQLKTILTPGIYKFLNLRRNYDVAIISTLATIITITNQEVLTQDNISLRLSYIVEYQITDSDRLINNLELFERYPSLKMQIESLIHTLSQVYLREAIAEITSSEINRQRNQLFNIVPEMLQNKLNDYGITINQIIIKDILFPKNIQKLFAQQLTAQIRAKSDLENARTAVATARTLKNAAKLMAEDENIKFIQFLETITKIAAQGQHTFILGDRLNPK